MQVTAILSLAAASASAGVTVLYFHDLGNCDFVGECQKYQMSVALAFFSWITIALSSLIMLWLLAAGQTVSVYIHRSYAFFPALRTICLIEILIFLPCQYKRKLEEYLNDFQNFDFSLSREIVCSAQKELQRDWM